MIPAAAAVDVDPRVTVPLALAIALGLVWYWRHLRSAPVLRRRVRRASIAVMLVSLPNFVRGLSYLDHAVQPRQYALSWTVSILLVFLVIGIACLDWLVTWRMQQEEARAELVEASKDLVRAMRERDGAPPGDPEDAGS